MRVYEVTITGTTPLLMHSDNIEFADSMEAWRSDPNNKRISKAGDDRSPAWRWLGCCYHDGQQIVMPATNIMRAMMEGGAMVPVPGGRGGKTFKAQTQSGMMALEPFWPLLNADGRGIKWSDVSRLASANEFGEHLSTVRSLGFDLLVKRAKIGTSKHIRVRPEFSTGWSVSGHFHVIDEQLTTDVLATIVEYAGCYKGLGDWRPGSKTPGSYGMFQGRIKQVAD